MAETPPRVELQLSGWSDPVTRLRQAIEKNEFALFCQPIAALTGDAGYAMGEVLVRMREEERALLPPGEFLPVLEHFGMMPQLDRWVVRGAAERLASGSRMPCLTVNLAGQTLEDPEFPAYVAAQLAEHGLRPERLAFEIGEDDILTRPQAAARFTAAYQKSGGKILIDGFGRRSVTFEPLKTLPAALVKVDGSIVRKVLSSDIARTKMGAILRVGQALGFGVVAECVEEQEVLVRLRELRVGYAQGFGVHQPHPIDSFAQPVV